MKPTITRWSRLFVSFLLLYSIGIYSQIGPGIAPVNSPNGGFNIDGTLSSNSAIGDWVSGSGTGGFVLANSGMPLNTKTTYHLLDQYNSGSDDIFGGGDKVSDNPNTMTWITGTANNKTDMNNALIHFTTDANGNVWFVFAADRLSNSGNAYIDFEFLQNELTTTATGFSTTAPSSSGGRTQGDFLVTVYFENGIANFDIQHWENVSGTWQYKTYFSALPLNSVYAAGNSNTIPVPYTAFGTNSYLQNTFIESAVNLTEVLGAIDPCANLKIKTIFVKSKTSTSPASSIKDFFKPLAVSNLTLGSANAGDDDTVCSGANYKLKGAAIPSSNYTVVSTTWSVISGSASIASPSTLDSYVTINGNSATFRLTVETHSGDGTHCIVYDDVIITSSPLPNCLITGPDGPICPSTEISYSASPNTSYLWNVSGNGSTNGNTTSQIVNLTTGPNCNQPLIVTLHTTDANGCSSTCSKTITVMDTTAPVLTITSGTLDQTLECDDTSGITLALSQVPTATDTCSATPTIHLVSDVTNPTTDCANGYSRVRTWNFTDGCGNTSANFVQTITVIDDIAPVVTTISGALNHTLQCNNASGIASALMEVPTATDNCSATPTMHLVSDVTTPTTDCTNGYSRVRTWNFTDGCGNTSANFVQTITVIDDIAPVVATTSGTLNHTLQCNNASGIEDALMEIPTATDNCSASPTIHLVSDVTTPTTYCTNGFSRVRTWNFTDDCGNTSANFVQEIIVQDTTAPIWITQVGSLNTTIECNDAKALANAQNSFPIASDNCDTTLNNIKKTAGEFVASSTCANSGTYTNTWNVTDDCGNNSETFTQVITIQDSETPKMITKATDIVVECDGQGNQNAITNWLANNGGAIASDNCSEIIWTNNFNTIANDCSAAATVVFTATDACGNSASTSATFSIIDTIAPTIASLPEPTTISCPNTPVFTHAIATDECGSDYSLTFKDVKTEGSCAGSYSITRTWIATDSCGNSSNASQTINVVDNTAPTIASLPEPTTITCPNTPVFTQAIATDECDSAAILTFKDVKTEGSCAGSYSITRTWTATDSCGNSSNASQTINVVDTSAPTIASLPEPTTISCPNTPIFAFASATDECGSDYSLTFKDVKTEGSCAGSYSITRTWTAMDSCGNSSNASQTINVIDNTAPTIVSLPEPTTISCPNTPIFAFASATDECGSDYSLTFKDVKTESSCAGSYSITRTWTATDSCGNSSNASQTINVVDTTAPTIASLPEPTTISCPNTPVFTQAIATDECDSGAILTFKDAKTEGSCAGSYSITRTWTATDSCGNSSNASQTINVVDTTAPTIASLPEPTTISCPNTPVFTQAIANDECGSDYSLTFKDVKTDGSCAGSYSITRTWTATDSCGNSSNASQTINVVDTTAPTIASLPEPTTISCPNTPIFAFASATDECGSDYSLTFKDVKTEGSCAGSYSITRTWTAMDSCGNSSNASQTINVEDKSGPITTTIFNSTITASCDAIPVQPELVFTDSCSSINSTIYTETINNQTADSYVINRKWVVSDGCNNSSEFVQTVNVTIANSLITLSGTVCNDGEITSIDLTSLFPIGTPTNGTWTDISNTGKLDVNNFNAASLELGNYIFEYTINDTYCPRKIRITITVTTGCGGIVLPCGTIVIHNAFSPNGDGINEKFVIDNINDTNCYPDNTVEIYNRWGVLVYSTKGYNNTSIAFDGLSDGRSTINQSSGLPTGTYFYIVTYTSFDNNNIIQTNRKEGYLFLTK
jgi:gliding motility-associated-like protein